MRVEARRVPRVGCARFRPWPSGTGVYNVRLMKPQPPADEPASGAGRHYFLVPPDIVAVTRTSPVRVKKRTPWHPQPDGQGTTARAGPREWFGDAIFCESQEGHSRSAYSMSAIVHTCLAVALVLFVITRPDQLLIVRPHPPLVMPAIVAPLPTMPADETPKSPPVERPQPKNQS